MKSDAKVIIGAILASVVVIIGAVFLLGNDKSLPAGRQVPKRETLGVATMTIDKKFEDFGDMKANEEKTATFTITNTSETILRIWNVATSCDCTFASILINDTETGEFNMAMHMRGELKNWIGEIGSRQTAQLKVTYRPKIMPVTGTITRQVTFSTNDAKNPEVEVSVRANVL